MTFSIKEWRFKQLIMEQAVEKIGPFVISRKMSFGELYKLRVAAEESAAQWQKGWYYKKADYVRAVKAINNILNSIKDPMGSYRESVNEAKEYEWDDLLDVLMTIGGTGKILNRINMKDPEVEELLDSKYKSYPDFAKAVKSMYNLKESVNEAAIDGDRQMITRAIENMTKGRLKVGEIRIELGRAIDQANISSAMKQNLKFAMQIKKESINERRYEKINKTI